MTTQPPSGTEQQIDFKYPWWDGNCLTYEDYKTRVELRADASKEEDLPFLGPRLASNLVGKAFDTLGEISRESLKKADGWSYLLKFLEGKRGRAKVDLLGDMFSEFFLKREAYRKDGEEWNDYEVRFRTLVRRMDRAVKEANTEAKIPSEMYGWFLLNLFMKLSPSDTANIRGKSGSYQMEDVMAAIKVMWSSGGLASRDQEVKVKKNQPGHTYAVDDEEPVEEQQEPNGIYEVDDELEEIQEWHDEAILALAEEPTDGEVLANFREARKALDQARTARGFYPVRQPGKGKGKGKPYGKGFGKGSNSMQRPSQPLPSHMDKICMRCGKKGHIAQFCPQKPGQPSGHGAIGFVGLAMAADTWQSSPDAGNPWCLEEDLDACYERVDETIPSAILVTTEPEACWSTSMDTEQHPVYALGPYTRGRAIIDSGASDNIVGAETLQELADCLNGLEFSAEQEIKVDREIHKQFVFGNNATSAGLGLSHVNAGMCGQQVPIQAHLVEGGTPFLLSSKFLYDMDATINFRSGVAVFKTLSSRQFKLERTPSHHLMVPLTAFAGNDKVTNTLFLHSDEEDLSVQHLSQPADDPNVQGAEPPAGKDTTTILDKGAPQEE